MFGKQIDRWQVERLSGGPVAGGVRQAVLADGPERGVRVLEFRTGAGLRFESMIDRAMDLGAAEFRGIPFSWSASAGFRHPGLNQEADPLAWLRSVNGLLATGGLDHTMGTEEVDISQYKVTARATARRGLHGRSSQIPARLTSYGERWEGDRAVLWAEGETRQAELFGEDLILTRRIESDLDGREIRVRDTVVNRGFEPTPHMLLYHANFGWPLLDEGARVVLPILETRSRTPDYPGQSSDFTHIDAPSDGYIEQVYEHVLAAGADGRTAALLVNDRLSMAIELSWPVAQLPCFLQWMMLRSGDYVLGLEPSTHHIEGDQAARDDGSMIWLEHGEERRYGFNMRVYSGPGEIAQAETQIAALLSSAPAR